MAIDVAAVKAWEFPVLRQAYTEKDTILYALALGYGSQPEDKAQLGFVYEQGLRAVPAMANTLCHPGFWINDPRTGIAASKAVHAEQRVSFHAPLPPRGRVRGQTRVLDVIDRDEGKGAMLVFERAIYDDVTGTLLARIEQHTLLRGDGGFSDMPVPTRVPASASRSEERAPDQVVELASLPQAALIYRLSADPNPLHADPEVARAAGFPRPILHGLCSYGIACRALLQACAPDDPGRLKSMAVRFSAPVFPGETLRTEVWRDGGEVRFRCVVPERGTVVISKGVATIQPL